MPQLWACGACGIGTEQPERHRRWHADQATVFHAPAVLRAKRCTSCQTLVLHPDIHTAWHEGRSHPQPRYVGA